MNDNHRWERLINIMELQKKLLDDFSEASESLRGGLHGRDWTMLENSFKKLDGIAGRLEAIEQKRRLLTEKVVDNQTMDAAVSGLGPETRRRFLEVRSQLKAKTVTVRSKTKGLASYADSRARLGRELMEELVPATRGRTYDKKGRSFTGSRDPMVVSRQL